MASGANSDNIRLSEGGATAIEVKVTAEDNRTSKTYTIAVFHPADGPDVYFEERIGTSDFRWLSRTLDTSNTCIDGQPGEQGCPADEQYTRYEATANSDKVRVRVPGGYSSFHHLEQLEKSNNEITEEDTAVSTQNQFTEFSQIIDLDSDKRNNVWVSVELSGQTTLHSLTEITTDCPASNANLTNLQVKSDSSTVVLSPNFASIETVYTANVDRSVSQVRLTPSSTPADNVCTTISIAGKEVASGETSGSITLTEGEVTSIPVVFTNGSEQTDYTIKIFRPAVIGFGNGSNTG
ncbi:MAG: cadherin-like beta sandwich domain-containing protein, partial [Aphanocapsa feldmannii 288cV]